MKFIPRLAAALLLGVSASSCVVNPVDQELLESGDPYRKVDCWEGVTHHLGENTYTGIGRDHYGTMTLGECVNRGGVPKKE